MNQQTTSRPTEIPRELDRWNWGAFLLNWIWGLGNHTFVALLALIPGVGFVMMVVLGLRGSRWAWKNGAWRDAEHFRRTQRAWGIAGAIVWLVVIGLVGALIFSLPAIMKNSDAYRITMETLRADQRVTEALGTEIESDFWINGSINVDAGGSGQARLSIPLTGDKGYGTAYSQGVRRGGIWDMRLIYVVVDGASEPIVLENEDSVEIPGVPLNL